MATKVVFLWLQLSSMVKKKLKQIGWREEIQLPDLTKHKIKAKVDTGARTSALHATELSIKKVGRYEYAHFKIHPNQDSAKPTISCKVKIHSKRKVRSSSGHVSLRPVILLDLKVGDDIFETEFTLVNRDLMGFRMLIGRKALKGRYLVNSGRSFLHKKTKDKK